MPTRRQERVGRAIQQEISELLLRGSKDPRLAGVTVTGVEVTPDLRIARVYVSVLGDEQARKDAGEGLDRAAGFLRREVAHRLNMRVTPELAFVFDESWDRGARIDELLHQIKHNEEGQ